MKSEMAAPQDRTESCYRAWTSVVLSIFAFSYAYGALVYHSLELRHPRASVAGPVVSWALQIDVAVWVVIAIVVAGLWCSYRSVRAEPRTGLAVLGAMLNVVLPFVASAAAQWTHPLPAS
jgi:hypothetical protein